VSVLDPDVALVSDGGGVVRAARRPVVGADKVARFLLRTIAKAEPSSHFELVRVNGLAGSPSSKQAGSPPSSRSPSPTAASAASTSCAPRANSARARPTCEETPRA